MATSSSCLVFSFAFPEYISLTDSFAFLFFLVHSKVVSLRPIISKFNWFIYWFTCSNWLVLNNFFTIYVSLINASPVSLLFLVLFTQLHFLCHIFPISFWGKQAVPTLAVYNAFILFSNFAIYDLFFIPYLKMFLILFLHLLSVLRFSGYFFFCCLDMYVYFLIFNIFQIISFCITNFSPSKFLTHKSI